MNFMLQPHLLADLTWQRMSEIAHVIMDQILKQILFKAVKQHVELKAL